MNEQTILDDFNPDESLLNQVNFNNRNFQNDVILIDKEGKQIKDKIEYNDQIVFK